MILLYFLHNLEHEKLGKPIEQKSCKKYLLTDDVVLRARNSTQFEPEAAENPPGIGCSSPSTRLAATTKYEVGTRWFGSRMASLAVYQPAGKGN